MATAIVAGNADGLGYAVALDLCAHGTRVAVIDDDGEGLERLVKSAPQGEGDLIPVEADFSSATSMQQASELAIEAVGIPSCVLHNSAVLSERPLLEWDFDDWKREVDAILQAAFILSKAVWQGLCEAGRGSVLYVSPESALAGFAQQEAFVPGKHGQEGLMKVLALAGREHNIASNSVDPGVPIDGPRSASYSEAQRRVMVKPEVLAPAFRRLAGIDPSFSTGNRLNAHRIARTLASVAGSPGGGAA